MTNAAREEPVRIGPDPWVVLGGGGMKGLAHVGAWKAIHERGMRVSGIVGCSIGALVGGCIAGGMELERMLDVASELRKSDIIRINRRAVWINGIRAPNVFRGDTLRDYIDRILPVDGWGRMHLPLQVNAVSLSTGRTAWFGSGARDDVPPAEAIYASAALPVFYPPARVGGDHFVDGGLDQALPLARPGKLGASGIVAIDVGSGGAVDPEAVVSRGMVAVHQRAMGIMTARRRAELRRGWRGAPLLYVRPRLDGYGTFDFGALEYFVEEGYRATKEALERVV